jgi:hypothetical protein
MYDPLNPSVKTSFEAFKSNICHTVKYLGDRKFLITMLENDKVREFYNAERYKEALTYSPWWTT